MAETQTATYPTGLVKISQDERLARHCARHLDCKCDYAWRGLGRLHGINMGNGWVRITTHPDCPTHVHAYRCRRCSRKFLTVNQRVEHEDKCAA